MCEITQIDWPLAVAICGVAFSCAIMMVGALWAVSR